MARNEEALATMVTSTIIELHNEYAAQPVKKFQDKATAVRRTAAVLDEAGMEFDEFCQLRPKPVGATTLAPGGFEGEGKTVEAAPSTEVDLPILDLNSEFQQMIDEADAEHDAAEEADKIAKQRASADRQPALKGHRLAVVGGKDAANPFREGSKSHAAFAYLQANSGSTYEELKAAGVRMRAITHGKKEGWIRTL